MNANSSIINKITTQSQRGQAYQALKQADGSSVELLPGLKIDAPEAGLQIYPDRAIGYITLEGEAVRCAISAQDFTVQIGFMGETTYPLYGHLEALFDTVFSDVEDGIFQLRRALETIRPTRRSTDMVIEHGCVICDGARTRTTHRLLSCSACGSVHRGLDEQNWTEVYSDESGDYFNTLRTAAEGGAHGYEDYDEWVGEILGPAWLARRVEFVGKHLDPSQLNPQCLDVGCATGHFVGTLIRQGYRAKGVDLSAWAIERARNLFPDGEFFQGTTYRLLRTGEQFDVISYLDVFEHLEDPISELASVKALLAPGGLLLLELPNQASLDAELLGPEYLFGEHLYFYSPDGIRALLERSGFRVIEMVTEHDRYFQIDRFFSGEAAVNINLRLRGERLVVVAKAETQCHVDVNRTA